MPTVALIGPDGAGKTTVARLVEQALDVPAKYIYMGVNREAGNLLLPTTRLVRAVYGALGKKQSNGPAVPGSKRAGADSATGGPRRLMKQLRANASRVNLMCEEVFRLLAAWHYQRRGYIVLFDRHAYFDFRSAYRARNQPLSGLARLHLFMLERAYPRPDFVICLDAPAPVLHARKGEGTLDALEYWRRQYLDSASSCEHFAIVDAAQPLEKVVRDVVSHVRGLPGSGPLFKATYARR